MLLNSPSFRFLGPLDLDRLHDRLWRWCRAAPRPRRRRRSSGRGWNMPFRIIGSGCSYDMVRYRGLERNVQAACLLPGFTNLMIAQPHLSCKGLVCPEADRPAGAEAAAVSPRKRGFAASGPPKTDRCSREGQFRSKPQNKPPNQRFPSQVYKLFNESPQLRTGFFSRTPRQVATLAASGESEVLECKATTGTRREAAATVRAMLNQRGGHVLFGVGPNGRVVGQQVSERTVEEVIAEFGRIAPPAFPEIERVHLKRHLEVIAIRVNPGPSEPYRYRLSAHRQYDTGYARRGTQPYPLRALA